MPRFVTDAEIERLVRLSSYDGPRAAREAGENIDDLTMPQVLTITMLRQARDSGMTDAALLSTFKRVRDEKAMSTAPATIH